MNIKITKEDHNRLCSSSFLEYTFGSRLHGTATEESDTDYIRIYNYDEVFDDYGLGKFLPNLHSLQYDDTDTNTQYVWMTDRQFFGSMFSGDTTIVADILLLGGRFYNPMKHCRTQNTIKAYLGVAKRDLKLHGGDAKKRFHAHRSLMFAEKLMDNVLPTVKDIVDLKAAPRPSSEDLFALEKKLRERLFELKLPRYPVVTSNDKLLTKIYGSNNINEFKY